MGGKGLEADMVMDKASTKVWAPFVRDAGEELERTFPSPNDIGTYPGHGEVYDSQRGELKGVANHGQFALDRMTASAYTAKGKAEGDRIADWFWVNRIRLGVRYVIWNKRIRSRTRDGEWHQYVNPVASKRGTASGDHTNHVHVSFFSDGHYAPIAPSAPSPQTSTGRPLDMASTKDVYFNYAGNQALVPGDNVVKLNADGDLSIISGATDGADVLATINVSGAETRSFFRLVSYAKSTPTVNSTAVVNPDRRATSSDQVSYKGSVPADKDTKRSTRLRLVVNVPEGTTGAVLNSVQVSGWAL